MADLEFATARVLVRLLTADDLDPSLRPHTSADVVRYIPSGATTVEVASAAFAKVLAFNTRETGARATGVSRIDAAARV